MPSRLAAAAALVASSALSADALSGKGNVPVALYSEAKCPDCAAFAPTFEAVWNMSCVQQMVSTYEEIPYGNAQTDPASGKVSCQHGPTECEGNMIEACSVEHSTGAEWLSFITCMFADFSAVPKPAQGCAKSSGLDWTTVDTCVTGGEGKKLIAANANRTDNLNPPHQYVPWLTVNGTLVADPPTGGPSQADVVSAICAAYTGKAPACCSAEALEEMRRAEGNGEGKGEGAAFGCMKGE
jgi:interferon, gamma-inducible protein 30